MYRDIFGKQLSSLIWDAVMFDWGITIQDQSKDKSCLLFFLVFFPRREHFKIERNKAVKLCRKGHFSTVGHGGGLRGSLHRRAQGLRVHRRGQARNARFQPKGALESPWHSSLGEFCPPAANPLFSCFFSKPWSTPYQLAQPFPLVKTGRTGLIMDENPQGLHRAFPTGISCARVKDGPSQLWDTSACS